MKENSTEASTTTAPASANSVWWVALKHAFIAMVISAMLLVTIYSIWFFDFHPEFERFNQPDVAARLIQGNRFRSIGMGKGGFEGSSAIITDYTDGNAAVSIRTRFKAEDYPFIKFDIRGLTRFTDANVFWRRSESPEELYQLPLNRSGDEVTQVAMVYGGENYKGMIEEVVIVFFDGPAKGFSNNNDVDIEVRSVELRPLSPATVAKQILEDWTNPPLWQGYSNNIVRGIHRNGMVFPNLVLNLLVAMSALLLFVFKYGGASKLTGVFSTTRAVLVTIALAWALGDSLRWHWRIEQLIDTHERYAGLPLEERIRNNPIRCERFPKDCRADLLPYF